MALSQKSKFEFKELAGLNGAYEGWRRSPPSVLKPADSKKVVSIGQAKVRRLANLLESSSGMGGSHLPKWDDAWTEALIREAHEHPEHAELAKKHWAGRMASSAAAEVDRNGDPHASQRYHAHAAQANHAAAQHMAAAGDAHTANHHAQWARHHDELAAMHAQKLAGMRTAHGPAPTPEKDPFPSKKSADTRAGDSALNRLHARQSAPKPADATAHYRPGRDNLPAPTKPKQVHQDLSGYEGTSKMSQSHAAAANSSGEAAHEKYKAAVGSHGAGNIPAEKHKALAQSQNKAVQDHVRAAMSLFQGGHHDKALQHFNQAIHHMNKHKQHVQGMQATQAMDARHRAGGGARAGSFGGARMRSS